LTKDRMADLAIHADRAVPREPTAWARLKVNRNWLASGS